ncbi:LysM peptidoglycan-binding domain-containing protein [Spongisporangium articulatum]|uniref:LysM peptidoglycan-binding domain-containing protein n=1 Tax=Spongisporangium articulatum TaxID=3362603 RepID=A0ABW8AMN5_9ACTN
MSTLVAPRTVGTVGTVVPAPALRSSTLRLTARGRRLVGFLVATGLLLAVVLGALLLSGTAQAGSDVHQVPVGYHVVLPGETLWQIAGEVAPGVDRRDTVNALIELNALPTAAVQVGQRLAVPAQA